ncbi:MAG: peptidoglycan editing factor PgeF [Acidaminococcaceae bacterium]|jgi:YfiH family protein|nr:peptidoglycan editing factor PgeF [Acidaminococcaceae bacterium]MCI2109450.1 peptidoglycan editing factor PgeF [Acidaminococcaceae bacterium]
MAEFAFKTCNSLEFGYFPSLEKFGVVHGFTCRTGGSSDLVPGGLNMALHVGDTKEKVLANRIQTAKALGYAPEKATTCAQVHGNNIIVVTKELVGRGAYDYADTIKDTDGLVTDLSQVPLMLFFADCVPVMLIDTKGKGIALVHAGWRGAVSNIAAKGAQLLHDRYGTEMKNIVAAIGPSIGPCCYEVDKSVWDKAKEFHDCFIPAREKHWFLNLWQVNTEQLEKLGIPGENILCAEYCTKDHNDKYFSYRAEQGKTGRLAAIIYRS